jgi:hypothetical protein
MARVGNTANLDGTSTYDVLFFDFPEGYPKGAIDLGFGRNPKRISGIQKIAQTFMKVLMTSPRSDVIHGTRGTSFSTFNQQRNIQTSDLHILRSDIESAIKQAELQTKSILNISSAGTTSQLESAKVLGIISTDDSVAINVQLISRAGESAPIALPFTSLGITVNE